MLAFRQTRFVSPRDTECPTWRDAAGQAVTPLHRMVSDPKRMPGSRALTQGAQQCAAARID